MQNKSMELSVGDSVLIGNQLLTVIDIDGEDISFKVETSTESEWESDGKPNVRPPR